MKTRIEDWEAFQAVVNEKSFSRAAKKLKVSAPMLTKKISRLEQDLGLRLFQRSTRAVSLTSEGERYLPALAVAFSSLDELENSGNKEDEVLAGPIRITAPAVFSQKVLPKVLSKFLNKNPEISIELVAGDQTLHLIDDRIDIAIRTSPLRDSSMIARRLCRNQVIVCASPQYLVSARPLKTVNDLKNHKLLFMDAHRKLRFRGTRMTLEDLALQRQFICNDGATLTEFALNKAGVAIRSRWDVDKYLASGKLVQVLKNNLIEDADEAWIYLPSRKNLPRRIRELVDFLIYEFAR